MSDQKSNRTKITLEILAVLGAIVALITAIVSNADKLLLPNKPENTTIKVPNLSGQPLDLAKVTISNKKLTVGKIEWKEVTDTKDGIVIAQYPDHNTEVEEGSQVDIVITQLIVKNPSPIEKELQKEEPPAEATWYIDFLDAKVKSIKFYETTKEKIPREKRVYLNHFEKSTTRSIGLEIRLTHPQRVDKINFVLNAIFRNPDGSIRGETTRSTRLEPAWISSYHDVGGWGWKEAGKWPVGEYPVEVYVRGQLIAKESFEIY